MKRLIRCSSYYFEDDFMKKLQSEPMRGKHAKMLTDAEKRAIATWIDLNATFYGCYEEPGLTKQLKGEQIPMPDRQ